MQVLVDSGVPSGNFGIIVYKDIAVGESPQMLKGRIRLFQESLHLELDDKEMKDISGVMEWRSYFKKNRNRPFQISSICRGIIPPYKKRTVFGAV